MDDFLDEAAVILEAPPVAQITYVCTSFPDLVNNKLDLAYFSMSQPDNFIWEWVGGTPTQEKLIAAMQVIADNDTLPTLKSGIEGLIAVLNGTLDTDSNDSSWTSDAQVAIETTLSAMYMLGRDISRIRGVITGHAEVLGLPRVKDVDENLDALETLSNIIETFVEVQHNIELCKVILQGVQQNPQSLFESG